MCYTGLSYSDLRNLSLNDLHTSMVGKRLIKISRNKTNEYSMVPLMNKAEALISKYKDYRNCNNDCFI